MALQALSAQRRFSLSRFGILVAALSLAGCQALLPGGDRPVEPPPTVEQPDEPDDTPITQGIPQDQQRHRVALLVPITGANSAVGQSIANAANMAILDTGGERVRITTYDTAASGGVNAAAQRALADGSRLFLGPLLSENVRAAGTSARSAAVPIIAFSNDTGVAGNGTYVLGFTPTQSIERVVGYAHDEGSRRFAALVPEGLYGQRAAAAFQQAVRSAGGSVVAVRSYERNGRSLQRAVTQLNGEAGIDAILIADSGDTARQAVSMIRSMGMTDAQILGTELWNNQPDLARHSEMHGALFASVSDRMFETLSSRYRQRFGTAPYRLASLGYDSALLVVRIAQEWSPGDTFPYAELTDDGGFSGVDGAFRFDGNGIAERALEVQRIGPGGFTVVSPAPGSFTD